MILWWPDTEVVVAAQNPESGMLWTQEIATHLASLQQISPVCALSLQWTVLTLEIGTLPLSGFVSILSSSIGLLTIRWCGFISTENDRHYPALICLYALWLQWTVDSGQKASGRVVDKRDWDTSTLWIQLNWPDHAEMVPSFWYVVSVCAFVAN